jgi:hypothetical protein
MFIKKVQVHILGQLDIGPVLIKRGRQTVYRGSCSILYPTYPIYFVWQDLQGIVSPRKLEGDLNKITANLYLLSSA